MTILKPAEGLYKEKGSRFIAFACPVNNENDISLNLELLQKKYHDARHHCYAWTLGKGDKQYKTNDDGEPSGTAGKPILGQIHALGLSNILLVVIRYFGGTLLGTGGLIRAYKYASLNALENAIIIKKYLTDEFELNFEYIDMNHVMKIIKEYDLEQFEQSFGLNCSLKIKVRKSLSRKVITEFSNHVHVKKVL